MTETIRIANPATDLERLKRFYVDGLGYDVIGSFADHEGFDGIIFGLPDAPYHLEFTKKRDETVSLAVHPDRLFVRYIPNVDDWAAAVRRMRDAGYDPVAAENPYWDRAGRTFEDPDGYRVVLQNATWGASGAG